MKNQDNIFDETLAKFRQKRARNQGFISFIHDQVILDLKDRLRELDQQFIEVGIFGPFAKYWARKLNYKLSHYHDDENVLPIIPNSKDLIISALYLHSINDPIARLVQMLKGLRVDGILFAYAFGENTLCELRKSFEHAEINTFGGVSPHINPMVDTRTFGNLLSRAGFNYCVSDKLYYSVNYRDPLDLLTDLRGMGETNVMIERRKRFMAKKFLFKAMDYYRKNFKSGNLDRKYNATFEIICLTGWISKPKSFK